MFEIVEASPIEMPVVRALFEEYQRLLGVDLCFQGFESELAGLPGRYAAPKGGLLLTKSGNQYCGCVGFRPHVDTEAELKRLFIKPEFRGTGQGKALFEEVMRKVREIGYKSIVLDTLPSMITAQRLYVEYGFREIPAYTCNPVEGVKYFRYVFD